MPRRLPGGATPSSRLPGGASGVKVCEVVGTGPNLEAVTGEADGAVLLSGDDDAVRAREGVRYVASSEIAPDAREVPVPDVVLDHWDRVLGGGTALAGGDDVAFATTDELTGAGVLRVLPAAWLETSPEE